MRTWKEAYSILKFVFQKQKQRLSQTSYKLLFFCYILVLHKLNDYFRRRDNTANGSMEDRKVFSNDGGGGVAFPYTTPFLPPNQFIHAYPQFTAQGGVFRLPFHHPNGEIIYHPLPPPGGQPYLPARPVPPAHLPFSPLVPPPKISCYNCGSQSHIGTDCPEATIEEITNKGEWAGMCVKH